jgi:hypothetical protein
VVSADFVVGVVSVSGDVSADRCHWCGRALVGGICPHCDRRRDGLLARGRGILRGRDDLLMPLLAVLVVAMPIIVIVTFTWLRPEAGSAPSGAARGPSAPTSTAAQVSPPISQASTFVVVGDGTDDSGHQARLGYAFVIRTRTETSDLLTDYDLVVARYSNGERTVDLEQGDRRFTATIIAVSPDPHVALLRIGGRFPALRVAARSPSPGDTVLLGPEGDVPAPRATVVAHTAPGRPSHLTFSRAVGSRDDGMPVLNLAGRVVGIAEPSEPFGTDRFGFAIPVEAGCLAVQAC